MGTVVKARFSRHSGSARVRAGKSSLDYFCHRPDHQRQVADRELILSDQRLRLEQGGRHAQEIVEARLLEARGEYLYSVVLSSGDPQMTRNETERWAVATLEANDVHDYLLVAHAEDQGHTPQPHVHALWVAERPVKVQELSALRRAGDLQRALLELTHQSFRRTPDLEALHLPDSANRKREGGGRASEIDEHRVPKRPAPELHWE